MIKEAKFRFIRFSGTAFVISFFIGWSWIIDLKPKGDEEVNIGIIIERCLLWNAAKGERKENIPESTNYDSYRFR